MWNAGSSYRTDGYEDNEAWHGGARCNGCGGAIRGTDICGERVTIDGIALEPDIAQPARVQFARH